MAFKSDTSHLFTQSLPVDNRSEGRTPHFNDRRRDSFVSGEDTMSFCSEGELSYMGSLESVSASYLTHRTQSYGALAMSPTGDQSRVLLNDYDAFSLSVTCTNCKHKVFTKTRYKCGRLTCLSSAVLGVLCCGLGCFVPCCMNSLKDVYHECPDCGEELGVYKRSTTCAS